MKIAIITAAGVGSRMKLSVPKQFYQINNKPIIVYTLEAFNNCKYIDAICVIYLKGFRDVFEGFKKTYKLNKIRWFFEGGETNQMSIWNGIKGLKETNDINDDDIILVHDGIRPVVDDAIIKDCIDVCVKNGNAVAVIPSNEAMFISKNGKISTESIDRSKVWRTQTPHAMRFKEMFNLVNNTLKKGICNSVAICTMLIENGQEVFFSKGNNLNFKLTTPEDIELFIGILKAQGRM